MGSMFSLNGEKLNDFLRKELNEQLLKAAEPEIEKAIKNIERKMREAMAEKLIALIDADMVLDRQGLDIRILIKQDRK